MNSERTITITEDEHKALCETLFGLYDNGDVEDAKTLDGIAQRSNAALSGCPDAPSPLALYCHLTNRAYPAQTQEGT